METAIILELYIGNSEKSTRSYYIILGLYEL